MPIVRNKPSVRVINGKQVTSSEVVIVSEPSFTTKGESYVIVKDVPHCMVTLDHVKTDKVKIKSFSNVRVITKIGKIDIEFDQIILNNGSCVEFVFCDGEWFITSSDGLKVS